MRKVSKLRALAIGIIPEADEQMRHRFNSVNVDIKIYSTYFALISSISLSFDVSSLSSEDILQTKRVPTTYLSLPPPGGL